MWLDRLELAKRVVDLRLGDARPLRDLTPLQLGPEFVAVHGLLGEHGQDDEIGEGDVGATRH